MFIESQNEFHIFQKSCRYDDDDLATDHHYKVLSLNKPKRIFKFMFIFDHKLFVLNSSLAKNREAKKNYTKYRLFHEVILLFVTCKYCTWWYLFVIVVVVFLFRLQPYDQQ